MRQISRGLRGALLGLIGLLSACSPELDWRELHSAEGRFKVLMPARPAMVSGTDAHGHTQVLWTGKAGSALFSVGYTDYSDLAQGHMVTARDALVRSARGKLVEESDLQAPRPAGRAFTIKGLGPDGRDRILRILLLPRGARLYQLAITGSPESVGIAEADTFALSFHFL